MQIEGTCLSSPWSELNGFTHRASIAETSVGGNMPRNHDQDMLTLEGQLAKWQVGDDQEMRDS